LGDAGSSEPAIVLGEPFFAKPFLLRYASKFNNISESAARYQLY
jgi:hypothetical protein